MDIPNDQVQIDQPTASSEEIDPSKVQLDAAQEIPPEEVKLDQPIDKYSTPGQQALTALEGAGQGLAGPIATGAELGLSKMGVPGLTAEDIQGRKEANPWTHGISEGASMGASMFYGVGEAGLLAKGAGKLLPEAIPIFGKLGSKVLSGATQAMAMQSGDEMTKAMLGQGDQEAPVSAALAHIGAAGLFGGAASGLFNVVGQGASKGLQAIENAKLGDKANSARVGLGLAAEAHQMGIPAHEAEQEITNALGHLEDFDYNKIKPGVNLYYKSLKVAADVPVDLAGNAIGNALGLPPGIGLYLSQKYLTPFTEKLVDRPLVGVSKLVMPTILNCLAKGETSGLYNAINHATSISKGVLKTNKGIEALFKGGGMSSIEDATDKQKKQISDSIDQGGTTQELQDENQLQFAEGGKVEAEQQDHFGKVYPEQSGLMNAAKGRVSNYLSSVKPQPIMNKLTYDKTPSSKTADKAYNNALNIAAAPLTILKHIGSGNLQAEDLHHMNSMYPEVTKYLQQKITSRIMQSQLEEERPSYKVRMAMSLFLGQPLDSTMAPMGIQAAQATYAPKQTPQPQSKNKKGTSNLGKSNKEYNTMDQSSERDRTVRD